MSFLAAIFGWISPNGTKKVRVSLIICLLQPCTKHIWIITFKF